MGLLSRTLTGTRAPTRDRPPCPVRSTPTGTAEPACVSGAGVMVTPEQPRSPRDHRLRLLPRDRRDARLPPELPQADPGRRPVRQSQTQAGGQAPAVQHALARPNPWQTPLEFYEMLTGHVVLRGNAYAEIVNGKQLSSLPEASGPGLALVPLHPAQDEGAAARQRRPALCLQEPARQGDGVPSGRDFPPPRLHLGRHRRHEPRRRRSRRDRPGDRHRPLQRAAEIHNNATPNGMVVHRPRSATRPTHGSKPRCAVRPAASRTPATS